MRRPRVLTLTYGLPYPPHSGGRLRDYHLLRALAADCDQTLLSLLEFPEEAAHVNALAPYCRRVEVVPSAPPGRWRAMRAAAHGWPPALARYYAPELIARLHALLAAEPFDIVQIENLELAPYIAALPRRHRPRTVLTLHNVLARQYQLPGGWAVSRAARWRAALKAWLLRDLDARYAPRFDAVITVSALDRERLLTRLPAGRPPVTVVDNGVDVEALQPLPPAPEPVLLFLGTLGYEPNMDAAQFFTAEVLPRVRAAVPAARLVIAGQHPAPSVLALAQQPGVRVLGAVPEVTPLYAQAQVVVVPLRAGGGTRLKILEALALGRALVSTPVGCEGLDLEAGRHLVVAEDAAALAEAVVALLRDPARRAALAAAGRARVVARYAWPRLAGDLLALYQRLLPAA